MSLLQTKWIADDAVNDEKVKLRNGQYLRGRNEAGDADVNLLRVNADDAIEFASLPIFDGEELALASDIPATFRIQGNWDADTNTPTLADGVNPIDPLEYPLYIVNVAGNTNLDGNTDWKVGDKAYFANGVWKKADNNDAVVSVNGELGVVVLDSSDLEHSQADSNNWTIADDAPIAGHLDELASRVVTLEGAGPSIEQVTEVFTLTAGNITDGFVTLSNEPLANTVQAFPKGGLPQTPGDDFTIANDDEFTFAGSLASLLEAGDKLIVSYSY